METLHLLACLAEIKRLQREYPDAERLGAQVLDGWRNAFGGQHLQTLYALDHLASVYLEQGKLPEAESLLLPALPEVRKALKGEQHPNVLKLLYRLADVYRRQSRFAEAEALAMEVLQAVEKGAGHDHPGRFATLV